MKLEQLGGTFAVCRLPPDSNIQMPASAAFVSITRTQHELSVVCEEPQAPMDASIEGGWKCLRVAGQLQFNMIGVLASLTNPLAEAGVSVFAVSTFDTDYLLAKAEQWPTLVQALKASGFEVTESC